MMIILPILNIKTYKEKETAVKGIKLADKNEFYGLIEKIKKHKVYFQYLNKNTDLFRVLI